MSSNKHRHLRVGYQDKTPPNLVEDLRKKPNKNFKQKSTQSIKKNGEKYLKLKYSAECERLG